jgi:hydroxymethylbilane synthase
MKRMRTFRIGTRDSALALFQAKLVQSKLDSNGLKTEIVEITSDGDTDLVTPLYEMGIQGIFTKSLDVALLQNRIDIAVHSTKDVPTKQAKGLTLSAVLERDTPFDCLVLPRGTALMEIPAQGIIATSSLRRKLQWLNRFPGYQTENLRGNIQTRLKKLDESVWQGAIFAQAALERLSIASSRHYITLDWMLPPPAQGAIGIVCREDDQEVLEICRSINHLDTEICITAERDFLAALHGGCAVPIAAHAEWRNDKLYFRGNIMSLDATQKVEVESEFDAEQVQQAGQHVAKEILAQGAAEIIKTFRPD